MAIVAWIEGITGGCNQIRRCPKVSSHHQERHQWQARDKCLALNIHSQTGKALMINSNLFQRVAGHGVSQWRLDFPYPPTSLWHGHRIVQNPFLTPSILAFGPTETVHNHPGFWTVSSPSTTFAPNSKHAFGSKADSARLSSPRDYGLLPLVIQAIDEQPDGKALALDIYLWFASHDPDRFPLRGGRRWQNRVRCCLSNHRELFMKTAERGNGYKFGRLARGFYWCRRPPEAGADGAKKRKPARATRLPSGSAVTRATRATATTSTISDAGRVSTTSQIR